MADIPPRRMGRAPLATPPGRKNPWDRPGPGVTQPSDDRAKQEKARLRPLCRARMKSLVGEARAEAERTLLEVLYTQPFFREASLITAYIPLPGELDLLPLWRRADAQGKRVAFPCLTEGSHEMQFRIMPGYRPELLEEGPHATRQPPQSCPALSDAAFAGALLILPGLSFDDYGTRLGYGGGYYDRFLHRLSFQHIPVITVGLMLEACRGLSLPREAHDIPVDYVISEKGVTVTHAT